MLQAGAAPWPQLRMVVHLVSLPRSRTLCTPYGLQAGPRPGQEYPRKLAEATSVSRTTRLTPPQPGERRRGRPGTRPNSSSEPNMPGWMRSAADPSGRTPCRRASSAAGTCSSSGSGSGSRDASDIVTASPSPVGSIQNLIPGDSGLNSAPPLEASAARGGLPAYTRTGGIRSGSLDLAAGTSTAL